MTAFEKLLSVKERVEYLLHHYPQTRDDDNRLLSSFHYFQMKAKSISIDTMPTRKYLEMLSNGELASFESISRMRRKLQEQIPSLRGELYQSRQQQERDVRQNINSV